MTFLACQPLTPDLLPAVLALDRSCLGGLWTAAGYQREIDSPNSDLLVLTRSTTDKTFASAPPVAFDVVGLGCLWSILEEAHITTLAIAPDNHRRKLGQLMLIQLLSAAQRRQLTHATLEVRISNTPALRLYEKFDFKVAGRRKKYYQNGEDALILWRSGLQEPAFSNQLQTLFEECQEALQSLNWQWLEAKALGPKQNPFEPTSIE